MKLFNKFKKYPFLSLVIISTLAFSFIGIVGRNSIYSDYAIRLINTPQLAAVFEGAGEGVYPWSIKKTSSGDTLSKDAFIDNSYRNINNSEDSSSLADNPVDINKSVKVSTDNGQLKGIVDNNKELKVDQLDKKPSSDKSTKKTKGAKKSDKHKEKTKPSNTATNDELNSNSDGKEIVNQVDSAVSEDAPTPLTSTRDKSDHNDAMSNSSGEDLSASPKNYQFEKVSKNYFNDALFIGDSRTVGLSEYSNLKNSTFYADVGLTIYDIFDKKIAEVDGNKVTILEALGKKQFKKIYIMLGINELGTGTTETFTEQYKKVILKIHDLQPEAIIFIEGIMNVAKEKSDVDPIFNNKNIKVRNAALSKLADNKVIFYIDVNEDITDKTGSIPAKYTFDSIHLKAAYYKIWTDFLMNHGVRLQ